MYNDFTYLRKILANWYAENGRILPWRQTKNPYLIWVSEIILQQTQVVQGLDYYKNFVEKFENVHKLATASQDDVMRIWQGLGYYSRARNMQTAAQTICNDFGGKFPKNYADVRSLKGIGDYTAAAVCSFAYDLPYATVDGNVYRVLARYFGIELPIDANEGKREFAKLAQELLDPHNPALHNQAMMDFGATQCTPKNPNCDICPLKERCAAFNEHKIETLPVKKGKTKVRERFFNYIQIRCNGKIYLQQRGPNDIWQGLYEFPLIENNYKIGFEELQKTEEFNQLVGKNFTLIGCTPTLKHVLSHQRLYAQCFIVEIAEENEFLSKFTTTEDIRQFPMSRLMEKLISARKL